jgi:hypothetical protein
LKRLLAAGLLIAAVASVGLTARPVFSQDSGVVSATVTVTTPCLTVPSHTIDYGVLPFANTITGDSFRWADQFTVSSCSVSPQSLSVRGQDMTGIDAVWSLTSGSTSPGGGMWSTCYQNGGSVGGVTLNLYRHEVWFDSDVVRLAKSDTVVGTLSAVRTSYQFSPALWMPCSGSDGFGQTMSTTITFTASY